MNVCVGLCLAFWLAANVATAQPGAFPSGQSVEREALPPTFSLPGMDWGTPRQEMRQSLASVDGATWQVYGRTDYQNMDDGSKAQYHYDADDRLVAVHLVPYHAVRDTLEARVMRILETTTAALGPPKVAERALADGRDEGWFVWEHPVDGSALVFHLSDAHACIGAETAAWRRAHPLPVPLRDGP